MSIIGDYWEERYDRLFKLVEAQEEYINFLGEIISKNAAYLYVHSIRESEEVINKGISLRNKIEKFKEDVRKD